MPSWNAPLLTNYIRDDVPTIQVLLHAAARWNPEDPTTEICTEIQNGFKRLVESTQTDSTITKQVRFETYNGETWKSVGKLMHDVDTLDGYHASKTSSAENFIPVYNANKKIAGGAEGEAGKAIKLSTARSIDIGGIVAANAQLFDGTSDITIEVTRVDVTSVDEAGNTTSNINGIIPIENGGTGNSHGYAQDIMYYYPSEDSDTRELILGKTYGQVGESKLINSTDIRSLRVPGNYVSRTVSTDYGFPYTDSSATAYINISRNGNSIIQRINMGGNNLWVNTSNDGGGSWLGLKSIGGAKQGSLTVYVSKSGSALDSGFDSGSPIVSIEHAIQIFYDFARGYSNAECKLCVGEGDWGSFTFRGLPFDLIICPFDALSATQFANSLPLFHGLTAEMGTHLEVRGVVTDYLLAKDNSHIKVTAYNRIGSLRATTGAFISFATIKEGTITKPPIFGVGTQSQYSDGVIHASEKGRIEIPSDASIIIEENVSHAQFLYSSSGGEVFFNNPSGITITQSATVTGKKYTINPQSSLDSALSSFDWASYLPGTTAGTFAVNSIINGIPYGGGDANTFLCADRTWKKVTTLPSLNVTGDTVLNGKLTVKGDFIIGTTSFLDKVYPVGSIYMSVNSTSPATLFGGTWEAIAGGRVLMGANSTYTLGTTGGSYTHTLSEDEMPTHTHAGSSAGAGGHSHTLGSMNATGRVQAHASAAIAQNQANGVFSMPGLSGRNIDTGGGNSAGGLDFTLKKNFSGASSTVANHTHTITIKNTGGGNAHNNIQPYLVVNMWKRTA